MSACASECGTCVCTSGNQTQRRRPVRPLSEPFAGAAGPDAVPVAMLLREVSAQLAQAEVPSPSADARLLVGHMLRLAPAGLATAAPVTASARNAVLAAAQRRAEREPLQHIIGEAPFRHLELYVGQGVFVPRPETEVVVDAALQRLPGVGSATVVDLGAGSGAISIAIATERPNTTVIAVELDAAALPWLTQNVMRYAGAIKEAGSLIRVVLGDAGAVSRPDQPLADLIGRVDLVVSNPPYIPDAMVPRDPEVRDYDPPLALYGGPDGLDAVRRWLDTAAELLAPGAPLVMEHADVQGGDEGLPGLLARHEDLATAGPVWEDIADHLDLVGRSRYTIARRAGG